MSKTPRCPECRWTASLVVAAELERIADNHLDHMTWQECVAFLRRRAAELRGDE